MNSVELLTGLRLLLEDYALHHAHIYIYMCVCVCVCVCVGEIAN